MEYIILQERNLEKMINLVNDFIAEGWQPSGGVSTIHTAYLQAMVKQVGK